VDIPIFILGPKVSPATEHVTPRKILHPVSLIGDYKKSLEVAMNLAKTYEAELTLLHVLDLDSDTTLSDVASRSVTWAEKAILAVLPGDTDKKARVKAKAVSGRMVEEVLKEAASSNADWIVLGVDNSFPALPFRNTAAYQIVARTECCLLAVRHDSRILEVPDDELSGETVSVDPCAASTF
jgi:nucleotide-binding universal stress UspA family protein